jgi:hypothetical protein
MTPGTNFTVTNGAMGLGFALCGVLLAWHRPRNPIGWLFLAADVADATSASAAQLLIVTAGHGWDETALGVLGSLTALSWPVAVGICLPMALLLYLLDIRLVLSRDWAAPRRATRAGTRPRGRSRPPAVPAPGGRPRGRAAG